jgi:hypothetical protein
MNDIEIMLLIAASNLILLGLVLIKAFLDDHK